MIRSYAKENSSVLLSVAASLGVLSTAYLTGRASFQAAHVLSVEDPNEPISDKVRRVWVFYIPAGVSAGVTVACIVGAKRIDSTRTLAAQSALAISQTAYSEYRDQVAGEFGDRKDKALLAKVAEKKVEENPPNVVIAGKGTVLCCELWTMRYFMASQDILNKAVNQLNAELLRRDYATMDALYYILDLQTTKSSGHQGWTSERLLEFEYSTILSPSGEPCIAFDYNYVKTL